jgi:hypothetical protein
MSEISSNDDSVSKGSNGTTILASLTALFEVTANKTIVDKEWREIVIPLAPFFALGITKIYKRILHWYKCNRMIRLIKGWIKALDNEISSNSTTKPRKIEAKKELQKLQEELKNWQKNLISIEFKK